MRKADNWKDYELIDCSDGERLERWGKYILIRPDPQVLWSTPKQTSFGIMQMRGIFVQIQAAADGKYINLFPKAGE